MQAWRMRMSFASSLDTNYSLFKCASLKSFLLTPVLSVIEIITPFLYSLPALGMKAPLLLIYVCKLLSHTLRMFQR